MRDDYKFKGETVKIEIELEKTVADALKAMEPVSKFSASQITNVALKKYITRHSDYLPAGYKFTVFSSDHRK
jgi:hypothetical protein